MLLLRAPTRLYHPLFIVPVPTNMQVPTHLLTLYGSLISPLLTISQAQSFQYFASGLWPSARTSTLSFRLICSLNSQNLHLPADMPMAFHPTSGLWTPLIPSLPSVSSPWSPLCSLCSWIKFYSQSFHYPSTGTLSLAHHSFCWTFSDKTTNLDIITCPLWLHNNRM